MLRNSRQGRRTENIWPSAAANWWRARSLRAPGDAAILADACRVNSLDDLCSLTPASVVIGQITKGWGFFRRIITSRIMFHPPELYRLTWWRPIVAEIECYWAANV